MKKRFFALIAALILASLVGAGMAESRTIRITPQDIEFTTDGADETKTPPSDADTESGSHYILNKSTKKIHYPDCSGVARMKEANKLAWNGAIDELLAEGYTPCGTCKPQ